jgi:hypothetical protein
MRELHDSAANHVCSCLLLLSCLCIITSSSRCTECISLVFDGMDKTKTRCPSLPRWSKSMDDKFRLPHHLIGGLTHGGFHEALLFSVLPWFGGGGNLMVTLILRTLMIMRKTWPLQHPADPLCAKWPNDLFLQFDNASGDGKNKSVLSFCAWLIYTRVFQKVYLYGSTHRFFSESHCLL